MDDNDNGSAEFSPIWQDVHVRGNFKWNLKSGTDPASTCFSLRDPEGRLTKWELHLESPPPSEENNFYLLVLRSKNVFDLNIKWKFLIYLPNRHGNREFSGTSEPELIRVNETRAAQVPALVLPSGQRLCLGPITISCELCVFGTQAVNNNSGPFTLEEGQKELLEDLSELFLTEETSDVDIVSGGRTFHCHELILAARSPVFRAMFQADMAERRTKRVEVQGLRPEVVAEMLTFIYTGHVDLDKDDTVVGELMGAADQYQLETLKKKCEEKLCTSLVEENCIGNLVLADLHGAEKLREMSLDKLSANMDSIIIGNIEDWTKLIKNHPDLAVEVTKFKAERRI